VVVGMTGLIGYLQAHAVLCRKTRLLVQLVSGVRRVILAHQKDLDLKKVISSEKESKINVRKNKIIKDKEAPSAAMFEGVFV
jgi:hypothetical protein